MTAYEILLCETHPEVIVSDEQYDGATGRLAELVRKGDRRSSDESRLMGLLAVLVEDYDRRHALPPDESSPGERLQYLMETSGRTREDLVCVFGTGNRLEEVLSGARAISSDEARQLGTLFAVAPGLFV